MKSGIASYITFKTHFAFLDYEKNAGLVFVENIAMIIFFAFIGHNLANVVKGLGKNDNSVLKSLMYIMMSVIVGFVLNMAVGGNVSTDNVWQSNTFQNVETIKMGMLMNGL